MAKQKWFHAIGICGKATSLVAKMFKDEGWFVTGSDLQFFPPASTYLEKNQINTTEGYSYKHLTKQFWEEKLGETLDIPENPNLALIIETASEKNKEYLFAKKQGVEVKPFSEILSEYLVKPNSIVVAGTAGKTTTTFLVTYLLKQFHLDPSYMIAADVPDMESIKNTKSEWSVIEGDEFHSKELSKGPKFLQYKPKYLIITNIGWEHQDVFPTQESYLEAFEHLVKLVPEDGLIFAKADDKNIDLVLKDAKAKIYRYSLTDDSDKQHSNNNVNIHREEISEGQQAFTTTFPDEPARTGKTKLLGEFNLENIAAAQALFYAVPELKKLRDSQSTSNQLEKFIEDFKAPKKRLEILYSNKVTIDQVQKSITVIDDFAVAPSRAKKSLKVIREAYPSSHILAVFDPNMASRISDTTTFKTIYENSFDEANSLLIPELSTFDETLLQTEDFISRLREQGFKAENLPQNTQELLNLVKQIEAESIVIVFFSAYRLSQQTDDLVQKLISIT